MDEQGEVKKRRGRPPKSAENRKGGNLTFRVRDGMRERLETTAKARGLSISEEVEARITRTFEHDDLLGDGPTAHLLRTLAGVIGWFEASTGKTWAKDPETQRLAFDAVSAVLRVMMAPREMEGPAVPLDDADPYQALGAELAAFDLGMEELQAYRRSREQDLRRLRPSRATLQARARGAPAEAAADE